MLIGSACTTQAPELSSADFQKFRNLILTDPNQRLGSSVIGPISFDVKKNYHIVLGPNEGILTDLFLVKSKSPAPLVIISHGNHSQKEAHHLQGITLASWGINALTVQVPNKDRWLQNGDTIRRLSQLVAKWPAIVGGNVDINRIILAGHSFGGSAITLAAGGGAPIAGLILLDPAVVHSVVTKAMAKVKVPTILLGADRSVFRARRRGTFAKNLGGQFAEISVRNATHDDAQAPSMYSLYSYGIDPYTSEAKQETFRKLLVVAAYSLSGTASTDYFVHQMQRDLQKGVIASLESKPHRLEQVAATSPIIRR
jgi:pimeloyl-ACP methyl ester carboxylesterase